MSLLSLDQYRVWHLGLQITASTTNDLQAQQSVARLFRIAVNVALLFCSTQVIIVRISTRRLDDPASTDLYVSYS